MTIFFLLSATGASTIAPTPPSSSVVTTSSAIQRTTQPPFIGKSTSFSVLNIHSLPLQAIKDLASSVDHAVKPVTSK